MIMHKFGIFGKVFLYTLLFLLMTVGATVMVFAQQFKDFYSYLQIQQYSAIFEPLKVSIDSNEGSVQIAKLADAFYDKNQAFPFSIENKEGAVFYSSYEGNPDSQDTGMATITGTSSVDMASGTTAIVNARNPGDSIMIAAKDGLVIRTVAVTDSKELYKIFLRKTVFFVVLLLGASVFGAALLAKGITKPIKKLAEDTHKMAGLQEVSLTLYRQDEVGQLARDVHNMYEKLKYAISNLQDEILQKKEMEENQRHFFSAASHELKTPIAATSALLEGMLAGVGDYSNHPKYLRECLNMMRAQNRIVTDILEIVKLSDEKILPLKERVALLDVIHSLMPEYTTLADNKDQGIVIEVPETAYCHTDRKMIYNVLSNVLMNAIQNSPQGESIRIWSEVHGEDTLRVSVLNTNAFIDDETKAKLFEPFYRVDQARNRSDARGGLGLTIVKRILDSLEVPFGIEMRQTDVVFWMDIPTHQ